jgi:hypothetical protein
VISYSLIIKEGLLFLHLHAMSTYSPSSFPVPRNAALLPRWPWRQLVGGSKDTINAYQEAHHREWHIKPSFNRKSVAIEKMITVYEEPSAFPWGNHYKIDKKAVWISGCHKWICAGLVEALPYRLFVICQRSCF